MARKAPRGTRPAKAPTGKAVAGRRADRHRGRPAPAERSVGPAVFTKVTNLVNLLSFVLATSDPRLRFRRFMIFFGALLGSAVVMAGILLALLLVAPADNLLVKVVCAALGVGATGTAVAAKKAADRMRRDAADEPRPAGGSSGPGATARRGPPVRPERRAGRRSTRRR